MCAWTCLGCLKANNPDNWQGQRSKVFESYPTFWGGNEILGHIPEGCILEMPFSQHILHCSLRSLRFHVWSFFFLIVQGGERHMSGVESQNSSQCLHLLLPSTITNTHLFPLYVLVSLMSVQQIKLLKKNKPLSQRNSQSSKMWQWTQKSSFPWQCYFKPPLD